MKTFRNILTVIVTGLILGISAFLVIEYNKVQKCREAMVTMEGTNVCINTPGCFYDADDLVDTKRALDYHKASYNTPAP